MERLTLEAVQPAPAMGMLELVETLHPRRRIMRQVMLLQLAHSDTTAFLDPDGRVVAALGFYPLPPERRGETLLELWFVCLPDARHALVPMARISRLTMRRMQETDGLRIRSCVGEGHRPGRKLARIMGLGPAGVVDGMEHWEWESGNDVSRQSGDEPLHRRR